MPAPSFQPLLNGRNHELLPFRCVQKRTSASSTAKCAMQRPNSNSRLARIAVALVLLDRVLDGLLGQAVLQLEGGDRQAVDEQPEVERERRFVPAVAQLAGDREAVRAKRSSALGLPGDGVP